MKSILTNQSLVNSRNEIEAMTIICNIQMMQEKVYGSKFEYYQFNGNTIDELRDLQDSIIKEYNASLTQLYKVVGKKDGQLCEISELPMSKDNCYRWIKEQGIESIYTNVCPVPYHGNKKEYILPL